MGLNAYIAVPFAISFLHGITDSTFLEDARALISMQKLIETSATCLIPIAFKWDKSHEGTSHENAIVIDEGSRRKEKVENVNDIHPLQQFARKIHSKQLIKSLVVLDDNRPSRDSSEQIKKKRNVGQKHDVISIECEDERQMRHHIPSEKDESESKRRAFELLKFVANYYITIALNVVTSSRTKRKNEISESSSSKSCEENTNTNKLIKNFKDAQLSMNIWASKYVTNNIDNESSNLIGLYKFAETVIENDRQSLNHYQYYTETRKICTTAILNYLNADVPADGYKYRNAFSPIQEFLKFKRTIFAYKCGYLPISPEFSGPAEIFKFSIYKIRTAPYGYLLFELGFPVDYITLTKNKTEVVITKIPHVTTIGDKRKFVIDVPE